MKRLLVIRFSALGDVALLAPVLRAAAQQYPHVRITMLSHPRMADLFADMPENITFCGVNPKQQPLREIVARLGTFDAVADMHGVWRSLYIRGCMRLRGAHVAVIRKGRRARFLLTHGLRRRPLPHISLRYAAVLARLGMPVTLPAPAHTDGQGIGIAPFAAHVGKIYPLDRMERVVQLLSLRGRHVVLFGSRDEKPLLDTWAEKYPNVENLAGRFPLSGEIERMRGLRVMLTMDSANMHLASLAGTRVLSVWGATHPDAGFLGYGQQPTDCILLNLPCQPCSVYGQRPCRYADYRCLNIAPEVLVERIIQACDD